MSDERTKSDVTQKAKADLESGKQRAKKAARDASSEGKARLEEQGERAATKVDDVADAVKSAASRLSDLEHESLAEYANQMASALSDMSGKLRDKNVDELTQDIRGIAQRNPALFLLGSVAVGLGLSRFAKATSSRRNTDELGAGVDGQGDRDWHGYQDDDFIPDTLRTERQTERSGVDRQMNPDSTGGSGL